MPDLPPAITFGLHPDHSLRFSLHFDVSDPSSVSAKAFPHGGGCGRFGVLDARLILSPVHLAVAGNAALLRNDGGGGGRTLAAETVLCASGTTHAGNAMKELAFEGSSSTAQPAAVIAFAYGVESEDDYSSFLSAVGLVDTSGSSSNEEVKKYFGRERSASEVAGVLKTYRLSNEEVHMAGSSLEKAVLTRIGSKFSV